MGMDKEADKKTDKAKQEGLNEQLEESFPASDAPAETQPGGGKSKPGSKVEKDPSEQPS